MSKGQKSRDKIIYTSIELFSKQGYDETSIQEIADTCSTSQANIFYHFKSKKVLFSEILKFVIQNNREKVAVVSADIEGSFECLVSLLEVNVEWCLEFSSQAKILLLLFYFASVDDEVKELATQTIDEGREILQSQLICISENDNLELKLPAGELAIIIQQYISAVMFQILARNDKEIVHKSFKKNIRIFLETLIYKPSNI